MLALGVVGIAAVAALLLGLLGGSTETAFTEEVSFDAIPTDGTAIVTGKAQTGGLRLFGVRLQRPDSTIDVALAVPPECVESDESGDEVLRHDGTCAQLPVSGEVVGGGTTADGVRIVSVRIAVHEGCSQAIPLGSTWPSDLAKCARP